MSEDNNREDSVYKELKEIKIRKQTEAVDDTLLQNGTKSIESERNSDEVCPMLGSCYELKTTEERTEEKMRYEEELEYGFPGSLPRKPRSRNSE